jgi:hypothetical protein
MLMVSPLTTVEILRKRPLELGADLIYHKPDRKMFGVRGRGKVGQKLYQSAHECGPAPLSKSLSERQLIEGLLGWFIDGTDPG